MLTYLLNRWKPTLTISVRDAEVVRKIILESGITVQRLKKSFHLLARHTHTSAEIPANEWHSVVATDISRVIDRQYMGDVCYISDNLYDSLITYRDNISPLEWYRNIDLILHRME